MMRVCVTRRGGGGVLCDTWGGGGGDTSGAGGGGDTVGKCGKNGDMREREKRLHCIAPKSGAVSTVFKI